MNVFVVRTQVDVTLEQRLAFHRAESEWHGIEHTEGLVGRLGGWVLNHHRAEIVALWASQAARDAATLPAPSAHARTEVSWPGTWHVHTHLGDLRAIQDTEHMRIVAAQDARPPATGLLAQVVGEERLEWWVSALHAQAAPTSGVDVRVVPAWRIPFRKWTR